MEPSERVRLSKTVSLILRHRPWLYELELDDEGWTSAEHLLAGLRRQRILWHDLSEASLQEVVDTSPKQHFEMRQGKIRALYGHSTPQRIAKTPGKPPAILYHGTTDQALDAIKIGGLRPMSRQYVHLSTTRQMAEQVGRRKTGRTIVLQIAAGEANNSGVPFYRGNELVWLADQIPPQFIGLSGQS